MCRGCTAMNRIRCERTGPARRHGSENEGEAFGAVPHNSLQQNAPMRKSNAIHQPTQGAALSANVPELATKCINEETESDTL